MEANFMSPLKRQKGTAQQAAGLFTPPPKKMMAPAKELMATPGPCTPGAGLKGAGISLLGQGQQTPQRMQAPLPAQLAVLRDILSALYATIPLVRSRGQMTTFQNMQQPVQNMSGRNFTLKHLRQIKHLYPDAFSWQTLRPAGPATPSSKPGEAPLLLGLVHPAGGEGAAGQKMSGAQQARELERRLHEYARSHTDKMGCVAELPLADLPGSKQLPASTPSKGSSGTSSAGGSTLAVPATPQTAGGDRLAALLSPSVGTPVGGGSKTAPPRVRDFLMSPVSRRPPRLQQAGGGPAAARVSSNLFGTPAAGAAKAPVPAGAHLQHEPATATPAVSGAATAVKVRRGGAGAKVRRLTFEDASPARDKAASAAAAKTDTKPAATQAEQPAAAAAQPVKASGGLFQLPAEALALLQSQQEHEVAEQQASAQRADLDASHALSLLPKSFEIVRGIFGERGPCVKPRDEVVSQLRQKCAFSCGLSTAQAGQQVDMLVRMLPEWLKQEAVQGTHLLQLQTVQQLRVNRQQPAAQLRAKLRAEVESATRELRAGGQAHEVAGEQAAAGGVAVAGGKAARRPLVTAGMLPPSDQGASGGNGSCALDDLLM